MGNVSDNDSTSPSTTDSPIPTRLGSSLIANGDQSSSLEWFDASESMTASSSPKGSVFASVINRPKDEVDSFFKKSDAQQSISNHALDPLLQPSPVPDSESKSSTIRFLGSPKRTLITCLHQQYELHLDRTSCSLLVAPPEEEGQKEQAGEHTEDMKPPKNGGDEKVEEHREEKKKREEHGEIENVKKEKTNGEKENEGEEEENEEHEGEEREDVTLVAGIVSDRRENLGSSSSPPHLLLLKDAADVLSDILSGIHLDSASSPSTPSSTGSPPTSFDDLTDTPSSSNPADVEVKKQKKKNRKKARQITKVNKEERRSRQRDEADRIREERLKKENALAEAVVVKEVLKDFLKQEEQQEAKQKGTNVTSAEEIEVHQEENTTLSTPSSSKPMIPSVQPYSTPDFDDSRSSFLEGNYHQRYQSEDFEMVSQVPGKQDEYSNDIEVVVNAEDIVEDKSIKTFTLNFDGESRFYREFIPAEKRNPSGQEPSESESSSSTSDNPVYDIPEHPPVVVPFRDAPIITTSSQLPHMSAPPSAFLRMPVPFSAPPPPVIDNVFHHIPPRVYPMPPTPGYPIPPPGVRVMRHTPFMMNRPMMFPPPPPPPPHRIPIGYPMHAQPPIPQPFAPGPQVRMGPPPPPILVQPVYPIQKPLVRPDRNILAIEHPQSHHHPHTPSNSGTSPSSNSISQDRALAASTFRSSRRARSSAVSTANSDLQPRFSGSSSSRGRSSASVSSSSTPSARSSGASPTSSTTSTRSVSRKPDKSKENFKNKSEAEKTKKVKIYVEKNQQPSTSETNISSRTCRNRKPSTYNVVIVEKASIKKKPVVEKENDPAFKEELVEEKDGAKEEIAVETVEKPLIVEDVKTEVMEQQEIIDIEEPVPPKSESEETRPSQHRRNSSLDFNGEVISSMVDAVLAESDDELPPVQSFPSTSTFSRPLSSTSESQQDNRVLGFEVSKQLKNGLDADDVWGKLRCEMPEEPKPLASPYDESLLVNFEEDNDHVAVPRRERIEMQREPMEEEDEYDKKPTLLSICRKIESFLESCGDKWRGSTLDSEQLRKLFIEAYGGQIPRDDWSILEKVCLFHPGYFNVFDAIIGSVYDWTYKFVSTPEFKKETTGPDTLFSLYQSLPPVDGLDNFFKRFEQIIMSGLIKFVSNRYVSVRTFVAIAEIVSDLTTSDLYYLATLVFGSRQFVNKFNARIKQLHVIENGGKRWVRQTMMDPLQTEPSYRCGSEQRMKTVADFLTRLRPHIDDILQLLPDSVVTDDVFFRIVKLVCGWNGEDEELIWKSIIKERAKFQEFHEAYRPFLRIEIRADTIYLRKLTYDDDDYYSETDEQLMNVVSSTKDVKLISSIKSEDFIPKEKKKEVTYAAEIELISPETPPEPTEKNRSCQTDNMGMDEMRNLEREVIRLLKRDNIPFAEFIQSENAHEMYQFLVDLFKERDLHYFAFILEKTLTETREEAWKDTVALRNAAEEARLLLEMSRAQHQKEFGELRSRMETISRFETYEVEVESNSRIERLKEQIKQLKDNREVMLKEEVKEERARQSRQIKEINQRHSDEKRELIDEIVYLKAENARLRDGGKVTLLEEIAALRAERDEMAARCENQMHKAKEMCENSSRLLIDSQKEIANLREAIHIDRQSLLNTPDSQESEPASEDVPSTSSSPSPPSPLLTASLPTTSLPTIRLESTPPRSPFIVTMSPEAVREMKIIEKYAAEFDAEELRNFARELLNNYNYTKANHKERKTAEKQLKEYEAALENIEHVIKENTQMIRLNVVEDLLPLPDIPMPFSETVMKKMMEYSDMELNVVQRDDSVPEEENVCLICTDSVEETCESIQCRTCSKEYHYHCISVWLKINSVCPACSRALKDPNEYPMLE